MKNIVALAILFSLCTKTFSQININFNYSNADNTIAFLKKKSATAAEIDAFIKTRGVQSIIQKIRSNDSLARVTLTKLMQGTPLTGKENDFQFHYVKNDLAGIENFITTIKQNEQVIIDSLQPFSNYLPAGKKLDVTVFFLLGSYSSGFTFSDPGTFYIGTHQYKKDFRSIVNTCQHEIFHNLQNLYRGKSETMIKLEKANENPALYAYYIARNFFVEGSAEFVADLDKADPQAPNIKELVEHAAVNRYRMGDNFYLAERLIMDAYAAPEKSDPDKIYSILFDWNWNNPGYAMGKWMMKSLVSAYGASAVNKYLAADPFVFLKDYISLAKSDSKKYPYNFSEPFEKMVDTVLEKINKL